jgi:predicted CXXCH cytochrome family protein
VKRLAAVFLIGGIMALLLAVGVASASVGDIFGSDHDLGSPGNPTCKQCHIPHNAKGDYLWARTPYSGLSGLQALCFSCHDGTVAQAGQYILDPNYKNHKVNAGQEGQDCDRCHNPHEGDNWKFVNDSIGVDYRNANVCSACHGTGSISHPMVTTDLPIDRTWDPNTTDFSGTRLWDATGSAVVDTGPGDIKCATCHTPHGAQPDSKLNTMLFKDPSSSQAPICQNCHY